MFWNYSNSLVHVKSHTRRHPYKDEKVHVKKHVRNPPKKRKTYL